MWHVCALAVLVRPPVSADEWLFHFNGSVPGSLVYHAIAAAVLSVGGVRAA
ncbi:hypothetical protein GCM10022243_43300 [Saccharothrix violaceirubra]